MFRMLIDTCVWLDIAKDPEQQKVLDILEELIRVDELSLIIPQTIIDEFARNKSRVIKESTKSLSSIFKRVKETVDKFGNRRQKKIVLQHLSDIDQKLPNLGEAAIVSVARIEKLFRETDIIAVSNEIKIRAAQRAIDKKAPFHRDKNSINDAILIEVYADYIAQKIQGVRYAFITHNTKDFSDPNGNEKAPHPDFAPYFSKIKSLYFIKLAEAVRKMKPELVSDIMVEQEWVYELRGLTEILKVEEELMMKIWYDRHQMRLDMIEKGEIKLVKETEPQQHKRGEILEDIWNGAKKAAKRVEKQYGIDNLGPWTEFEWGMLNGKLSAIRWIMGDEWDNLDT